MFDFLNYIGRLITAFFKTLGYIFEALSSSEKQPNVSRKKETKTYIDDSGNNRKKQPNAWREEEGKTYINDNGYRCFIDTDTPVHRWVAEKKLRRKLNHSEVVHHINRNKLDNSPENLQVFPNQEAHDEQHRMDEEKYGFKYSYLGKRKY